MVDTRFSVSLQIMVTLAVHAEELMNSQELASVLKTNPTFVRKLTARLVEAGLIESFRGKSGGIRLSRCPHEINLAEIYSAALAEKVIVNVPNKPVTKACKVSCSIKTILCDVNQGVERAIQAYLSKRKLSELVKSVGCDG